MRLRVYGTSRSRPRTARSSSRRWERARALEEAVTAGPPPLGEGAPDRERLLAFLDAIVEVISRNKSLMAELAFSAAALPPASDDVTEDRNKHPVYRFWHDHISALIAAQRPDTDAGMMGHLLLGSLHSEPILSELATSGPERLARALRARASSLLDAQPARIP